MITFVGGNALTSGFTRSCGCLQRERSSENAKTVNLKHGLHKHPLYRIWSGMKRRCLDPTDKGYKNYGGRGIKVCRAWMNPETFIRWGIAQGYVKGRNFTLDRYPNNNGDYKPSNCRFTTMRKQMRNKRNNVLIRWKGERKTVAEWSESAGLSYHLIWCRLKMGWKPKDIFTRPVEIHRRRAR